MKEQVENMACPCDSCHAPKIIKDSVCCNRSRLVNAAETLMRDLAAGFGCSYSPKYKCEAEFYFDKDWWMEDENAD